MAAAQSGFVVQLIFSGSFSFALIDRLSGGAFLGIDGADEEKGLGWLTTGIKDGIIQHPFLWWWLNILWMAVLGFALSKLMTYLGNQALGAQSIAKVVNRYRGDSFMPRARCNSACDFAVGSRWTSCVSF